MPKQEKNVAEQTEQPLSWLRLLAEFERSLKASVGDPATPEFWQHLRAARKEGLLAMRSLLDAKIEHIEEKERAAKAGERTASKITVE